MPMTISGSGTITGLTPGGLPDETVTPDDLTQKMTLGSSQATTSGTIKEFTGIPSWVKRITVMFQGVSTSGTSATLVQIGTSSGVTTTGYVSVASRVAPSAATALNTSGFNINNTAAADTLNGCLFISLLGSNAWASSHSLGGGASFFGGGSISLSGTLDRIRITTVNGTDTFDAGSVNIMYEG